MQYPTCTMIDKIFGFKNSFLFISVNCDSNTSCHVPNATVLSKYKLSQISRNFLNTLYIKLCDFIFKSKSIRELISNLLRIES